MSGENNAQKRKPGRPVGPRGKRLELSKNPVLVDPLTLRFLTAPKEVYGLPVGRTLDQLVEYVKRKHDFRLSLPSYKKQTD